MSKKNQKQEQNQPKGWGTVAAVATAQARTTEEFAKEVRRDQQQLRQHQAQISKNNADKQCLQYHQLMGQVFSAAEILDLVRSLDKGGKSELLSIIEGECEVINTLSDEEAEEYSLHFEKARNERMRQGLHAGQVFLLRDQLRREVVIQNMQRGAEARAAHVAALQAGRIYNAGRKVLDVERQMAQFENVVVAVDNGWGSNSLPVMQKAKEYAVAHAEDIGKIRKA